jgi:hypothetical protein
MVKEIALLTAVLMTVANPLKADRPREHLGTPVVADSPASASPATSAHASSPFAIADFDGDSLPDLATVTAGQSNDAHTRYWIRLQLSSGLRQAIGITAPSGGLHVAPRDVNGDSFPDLVVTTLWQQHPVAVLLNDGHGNFTVNDPSRFSASSWGAQRDWTAAEIQIRDATAAILTSNLSGDHETENYVFHSWHETKLVASKSNIRSCLSLAILVFGRAPPCIRQS